VGETNFKLNKSENNLFLKIERGSLVLLFGTMIILGFVQVMLRYIFEFSAPWTEELARYSMVWMVMIGTALAIETDAHIKLDVLSLIIKQKKILWIIDIFIIAILLVFAVYYCWSSINYIIQLKITGERAIATGIPMIIPQSGTIVGAVLLILHLIRKFTSTLRQLGRG